MSEQNENRPTVDINKPQPYNITFHKNGTQIGALDFTGPKMTFVGDAEESAKNFSARLEEEREAGRLEERNL